MISEMFAKEVVVTTKKDTTAKDLLEQDLSDDGEFEEKDFEMDIEDDSRPQA